MKHPTDFQINEYLDNRLDTDVSLNIELHLRSCADCRMRLEELRLLFTSLESLPEEKLRRDLSPAILARLPQRTRIWTPFFAAQLGAALGAFFWLCMQIDIFITPIISAFRFSTIAAQGLQLTQPVLQFPDLHSMFSIFIPHFTLPKFQLPAITADLLPFNFTFIAVGVSLLWLVGNLSLLRNHHGVKK